MKCVLLLSDRFKAATPVEIEFYPQMPAGGDIDERNVVFEDGHYQGGLHIEDADVAEKGGNIETIELFLNGDTPIGHANRHGNAYVFRFEDASHNETTHSIEKTSGYSLTFRVALVV